MAAAEEAFSPECMRRTDAAPTPRAPSLVLAADTACVPRPGCPLSWMWPLTGAEAGGLRVPGQPGCVVRPCFIKGTKSPPKPMETNPFGAVAQWAEPRPACIQPGGSSKPVWASRDPRAALGLCCVTLSPSLPLSGPQGRMHGNLGFPGPAKTPGLPADIFSALFLGCISRDSTEHQVPPNGASPICYTEVRRDAEMEEILGSPGVLVTPSRGHLCSGRHRPDPRASWWSQTGPGRSDGAGDPGEGRHVTTGAS